MPTGSTFWFRLRKEKPCHLILIHSQAGSGMTGLHDSYKEQMESDQLSVPVMLVDEPACSGELDHVRIALRSMAKSQEAAADG